MRRYRLLSLSAVLGALLMLASGALPASAATTYFGAKLTKFTQPQDFGQRCDESGSIPANAACTWVAVEAFENGDRFKAPKNGRIKQVRVMSCVGGKFTLQIVRKQASGAFKLVRSGPVIRYKADPYHIDGDDETFCGGDEFEFVVQKFSVDFAISKGSYIAIKAKKAGPVRCAGGATELITPPLSTIGQSSQPADSAGCNLLVALYYA